MRRPKLFLAIFSIILVYLWVLPGGMLAQDGNQAALVIRHSDQSVQTVCVDFSEPEISGLELMQRSGIDLELDVQGLGAAVCRIGQTGCPANDCWCECKGGGDCTYWSYWLRSGGQWQYSQGGASAYTVSDGDIQGWSWGPGAVNLAYSPPDLSFENICTASAVEDATATPSSTAIVFVPADTPAGESTQSLPTGTLTPTPSPTSTNPPTATILLTATIVPTNTPLPIATAIAVVEEKPTVTEFSSDNAPLESQGISEIESDVAEPPANIEQEIRPTATIVPSPTPSPLAQNNEMIQTTPDSVIAMVEPDQSLPARQGERENKKWVEDKDDQPSNLSVVGTESEIPDLRVLPLATEEKLAAQEEYNVSSSSFSYMFFVLIVLGLGTWWVILSIRRQDESMPTNE
jgi:hypothetical protein